MKNSNLSRLLKDYSGTDIYPFHMPGHKRNPSCLPGFFPLGQDITEIDGFDNLHHPEGVLKEAQEFIAKLYDVPESFYSVNGSTAALLAAISASVKKGGKILMARNCHKAAYHAVYLRDLQPVYLYPRTEPDLWINGGILPEDVERSLAEHPDVEAVLITSPTYDGVVSDVKKIGEIAHDFHVPLIVDEAHGAHFHFSSYFPVSAAELGADLVIQSLHKTLPSMTQTAVLHKCSDRVDRDAVRRFMGIYQSSSPSYILMASMDACMHQLSVHGEEMFREFTERLEKARKRLSRCSRIRLFDPDRSGQQGIFDYDRSKIVLSVKHTSLTGKQLHEILLENYHLQMEMASEDYVIALSSVGDTPEGFERLCRAVEELDRKEADKKKINEKKINGEKINKEKISRDKISKEQINPESILKNNIKTEDSENYIKNQKKTNRGNRESKKNAENIAVMSIASAMDAPCISLPLEESIGRISSEFVYLYPPGIPILTPGEQITGQIVENMRRYRNQGLELQGMADFAGGEIRVVAEGAVSSVS